MSVEGWLSVIETALKALFEVAPTVVGALTGGQTVEEAIASARSAIQGIPVRTGPGGTWERDLDERKRRNRGTDEDE